MLSHLAAFAQLQQVTVLAVCATILCAHTQLLSPGHAGLCQERCFCALTLSQTGDKTLYHIHHNTGCLRLVDQVCSITKDESSSLHFSPAAYKKSSFLRFFAFCALLLPLRRAGGDSPKDTKSQGQSWDAEVEIPALGFSHSTCCLHSASVLFISWCTPAFCPRRKGSCK